MEKEKILQQLEEKLLPSVQNLERNQATEHDFFPALLWLLLAKSKDSESLLNNISLKYSEELKNISATIVENNKVSQEKAESLLNDISSKYSEELKNIAATIVENNKIYHEKITNLFENKILAVNQKIEDLKSTPLKIEKKFPIGFLVLSIFQLINLTIVAVILMKQL